jgi:hypothetical protein
MLSPRAPYRDTFSNRLSTAIAQTRRAGQSIASAGQRGGRHAIALGAPALFRVKAERAVPSRPHTTSTSDCDRARGHHCPIEDSDLPVKKRADEFCGSRGAERPGAA